MHFTQLICSIICLKYLTLSAVKSDLSLIQKQLYVSNIYGSILPYVFLHKVSWFQTKSFQALFPSHNVPLLN